MNVVVTGGSGYVGSAVLTALAEAGHQVKAIARRPGRTSASVQWVAGDIRDMDLLEPFQGADVVVHLIGIIKEIPRERVTFDIMHVDVTRRVIAAMQTLSIRRLIHMSALGTRANAISHYHRSKWQGEQVVHASPGIEATILRPSLIFGGDAPFFTLLSALSRLPVAPVPGDGLTRFQPVFRNDVSRMMVLTLQDGDAIGNTYELGGPDRFTLNELYDIMAKRQNRESPPKFHVPLGIIAPLAHMSTWVPIPLTPDQLSMLTEPNITEDTRWQRWIPHPYHLADL